MQTVNVANPMSAKNFINPIEEAVTHTLLSDAEILDQDNEQEAECIEDEFPELSEEDKIMAFSQVIETLESGEDWEHIETEKVIKFLRIRQWKMRMELLLIREKEYRLEQTKITQNSTFSGYY